MLNRQEANAEEMHIYVFQRGDLRKVGVSHDVEGRARGLGARVEWTRICESDIAARAEFGAHWLLGASRHEGEWFRCSRLEAIGAIEVAVEWARSGSEHTSDLLGPEPEEVEEHARWHADRALRGVAEDARANRGARAGSIAAAAHKARLTAPKLAAARELWLKPVGEISVAGIAEQVGLSPRTLYQHLGPRSLAREGAKKGKPHA